MSRRSEMKMRSGIKLVRPGGGACMRCVCGCVCVCGSWGGGGGASCWTGFYSWREKARTDDTWEEDDGVGKGDERDSAGLDHHVLLLCFDRWWRW